MNISLLSDQCYPSSDDNTNEDWQALGFSERDFEYDVFFFFSKREVLEYIFRSLGRDLNRPGSCMFALLLMIYLAVEENEAAGVVLKVVLLLLSFSRLSTSRLSSLSSLSPRYSLDNT